MTDLAAASPVRLSGVRGLIARRMTDSLKESAQLSFHASADASQALALVASHRERGVPLSLEDVAAWVFVKCLKQYPSFNGLLIDKSFQPAAAIHLGMAIGVTEHLTVAVVRDAQAMTLETLGEARRELIEQARAGTLAAEQMRDGTVTVSNLGKGRTESFTPILNPPQVALLGVSAVLKQPRVVDDQILIRPVMGLSLTVDHRWIDGAPANQFLSDYCQGFESVAT